MSGCGWCRLLWRRYQPCSCSCCFFSVVSSRFHERRPWCRRLWSIRGKMPAIMPHEPATGQREEEREKKEPSPSENAHRLSGRASGKHPPQGFQGRQQRELSGRIAMIAERHHKGHEGRRAHPPCDVFNDDRSCKGL